LGYVTNHLGTATGAFNEAVEFVRERPYLAENPFVVASIGDLSSKLAVARSALYASARLWEQAAAHNWEGQMAGPAELLALQTLHVVKQVALRVTRKVFDICGARAAFLNLPFDAMFRDVRTFTLHFRDDRYMMRVAEAVFEGPAASLAKTKYTMPPSTGRYDATVPQG
jgi:alkylation response protein AidB-like acyl-CoA dehydrogenase